ncbi:dihydropteroate synthase-like [Babylonia areolata]|uniref:dihydropteroate synthase-like n=1 Tax=Babylonia areolata TaxID=304850 RepID=UPI003FD6984B
MTFDKRRVIMGILNVTPDSFSDGGEFYQTDTAVAHGLRMAQEDADIIDEEPHHVIPVIKRLAARTDALISVDTSKARVAAAALEAGAQIVNDMSGLGFDPAMAKTVAEHDEASLVLMHIRGTPQTMETQACCQDVVQTVMDYFAHRLAKAEEEGIDLRRIAIDPGIGFGKDTADNYTLQRPGKAELPWQARSAGNVP